MIHGAVGIVDSEVDAELAGTDLLDDLLDVAGQGCGQMVPARESCGLRGGRARLGSNRSASNFFMYGSSNSVDSDFRL